MWFRYFDPRAIKNESRDTDAHGLKTTFTDEHGQRHKAEMVMMVLFPPLLFLLPCLSVFLLSVSIRVQVGFHF